MANLNRKGPMNEGPMTGRKLGRCNKENKGKTDTEIMEWRASTNQARQGMHRGLGCQQEQQTGFVDRCKEFFGMGQGFRNGKGNGRRCAQGRGRGFGRGNGQTLSDSNL